MSEMWRLQGVQRQGFPGVWRGGRLWPSAAPVDVEVLDQDDCPMVEVDDKDAKGGKRQALDPLRVGRAAWATIWADGRISKTRVGGEEEDGSAKALRAALRQKLADAEERALAAEVRADRAEKELAVNQLIVAELRDGASDALKELEKVKEEHAQLQQEHAQLRAKLAEFETLSGAVGQDKVQESEGKPPAASPPAEPSKPEQGKPKGGGRK